MFTYQVKVANMDPFDSWDISVRSDPSILQAVDFDVTGNLLGSVFEAAHCVNGVGTGCSISDTSGIVHSTALSNGGVGSGSGLLFTIMYKVAGSGYSFITIPPGLDFLANAGSTVSHIINEGVYGTAPFTIAANPTALTVNVGSFATSTITLQSNTFTGNVNVSATVAPVVAGGPSLFLKNSTSTRQSVIVKLTTGGTVTVPLNVSTTPTTTIQPYTVTVLGNGTSVLPIVPVFVNVVPFTIRASPDTLQITAGSSQTSTLTLASSSFAGSVPLTAVVSPAIGGPAISLKNSTVMLASGGTVTTVLNVTAPGSIAAGIYTVTVTGTSVVSSGTVSNAVTVIVRVGDFTISTSPVSFNTGASGASVLVSLTSRFNFAGGIALASTVTPPTGLTVACPATAVNIAANATVTASCALSSSTPGIYSVTISGTGSPGTASHQTTLTVHVGDFIMSVGSPVNLNSGASVAAVSVSLTSVNNFAGTVALSSLVSATIGLTVTCPATAVGITANATVSSSCTLSSTTAGTYLVKITGAGSLGTAFHSASSVVHVGDFTIGVGSPVNLNSGATGAAISVSLTSTFNFAGTVSLSAVTNPATGLTVTCPATATSLTANGTASASCTLSSTTAGTYLVTITGTPTPGTTTHQASSIVHIGDFTISVGTPVNFNSGATGAAISVSLTSTFNFAGTVSLSSVVSPTTGLTVTCPATATSLTPNATVSSSCTLSSTTAGTYLAKITGAGSAGTVSHFASSVVHVGDFKISATNTSLTAGQTGISISVTILSTFNYAGSVTLSGTATPSGLMVTCPTTPVLVTANATTLASCSLSSTTNGDYAVNIGGSGTPGTVSHIPGTTALVTVAPAQPTSPQPFFNATNIALIGGVLAVALLVVAFLLFRRRRGTPVG